MTATLADELRAEADRWTDYAHLDRRPTRARRAALLRQAADAAEGHDKLCEELQEICERHGCPAGMNRVDFIRQLLGDGQS